MQIVLDAPPLVRGRRRDAGRAPRTSSSSSAVFAARRSCSSAVSTYDAAVALKATSSLSAGSWRMAATRRLPSKTSVSATELVATGAGTSTPAASTQWPGSSSTRCTIVSERSWNSSASAACELVGPRSAVQAHGEPLHRLRDEQAPAPDADEERQGQERDRERQQPRPDVRRLGLGRDPAHGDRGEEDDQPEDRDREHGAERPLGERGRVAGSARPRGPSRRRRARSSAAPAAGPRRSSITAGSLATSMNAFVRAAVDAARPGTRERIVLDEDRGRQVQAGDERGGQPRPGAGPCAPGSRPTGNARIR